MILVKLVLFAKLKKSTDNFFIEKKESKQCNSKGVLKRDYNNKEEILQQRSVNVHVLKT